MTLPLIIYYGNPGLESQVFQSYMVSSGYKVQVVSTSEGASSALDANPVAIAVIALQNKLSELMAQAYELRSHTNVSGSQIFVLSSDDGVDTSQPGVVIIPRPYRLSELVRRIQALTKTPKEKIK